MDVTVKTRPCANADDNGTVYRGEPVVRLPWQNATEAANDFMQVVRPFPPVYLAEFAGVLTRDLADGANSPTALASDGPVKANLYIPSSAEILAGPYTTPIVGCHLLPATVGGVGCFIPILANTGILLREDGSALVTSAGFVSEVKDGGGAWVDVKAGTTLPQCKRLFWLDAAASDDDKIKTHTGATGGTVTTFDGQPAEVRNLIVTVSAATTNDLKGGDVVVNGRNVKGDTISETFTITDNTPAVLTGTKAFFSVISIVFPNQDGATATIKVGTGTKLGLPYMLPNTPAVIEARRGATKEGTLPTFTADANEIEKNLVVPNTALDATVFSALIVNG